MAGSGMSDPWALERFISRRELLRLGAGALAGVSALGAAQRSAAGSALDLQSAGSTVAEFDAEVPYRWFQRMLQLTQMTPGFSPPVASRAFGYAGLALYESLVPGMNGYQSLVAQREDFSHRLPAGRRLNDHWPTVANSALSSIARLLFATAPPELQDAVDELEQGILDEFRGTVPVHELLMSLVRGRYVAFQIFRWSMSDGGHEGYLRNFPEDYAPPVGDGLWEPTPPGFARALQPYWGANRTFAIGDPASIPVDPPPPFSSEPGSAFYQSAYEVFEVVNNLTPEQETIARFWSDDPGGTPTPPGHSLSILNQIIAKQGIDLARAAEAYARVGMAVADAFICCWHTKFVFNLMRPITYIQRYIDSGWGDPLPVTTPPFPEYTSGHSVQSGATAKIMTDLFGDLAFADHTHDSRGFEPRSFASFFEFADEAAISRLYGGIHFREAIEIGVAQGILVGEKIGALPLKTS